MENSKVKSKYELIRNLNSSNFKMVRKMIKGSKRELINELTKLPHSDNEYVVIMIDGKEMKI